VTTSQTIDTDIPARLDRLRWSRFHLLVVGPWASRGSSMGLEVTLAGSVAAALKASPSLHLTDAEVGVSASACLAGAVLGALLFGWLGLAAVPAERRSLQEVARPLSSIP
jgi:hypothetical protein